MCKHFFLIDDDEDELDILMEALSKLRIPCKCTYAQTAEQGLEMLTYLKPDLVFIDINMPRVGGFECVQKIRAKEGHGDTHIVMYSNGVNEITLAEAQKWGATSCIKKTNSIADLVVAMENLLGTSDPVPAQRNS
ncbi:MAG: response regulator [Proteobacteria bacterium]|nr:MAG: response regulator [Pseudomonadota bacterium]